MSLSWTCWREPRLFLICPFQPAIGRSLFWVTRSLKLAGRHSDSNCTLFAPLRSWFWSSFGICFSKYREHFYQSQKSLIFHQHFYQSSTSWVSLRGRPIFEIRLIVCVCFFGFLYVHFLHFLCKKVCRFFEPPQVEREIMIALQTSSKFSINDSLKSKKYSLNWHTTGLDFTITWFLFGSKQVTEV